MINTVHNKLYIRIRLIQKLKNCDTFSIIIYRIPLLFQASSVVHSFCSNLADFLLIYVGILFLLRLIHSTNLLWLYIPTKVLICFIVCVFPQAFKIHGFSPICFYSSLVYHPVTICMLVDGFVVQFSDDVLISLAFIANLYGKSFYKLDYLGTCHKFERLWPMALRSFLDHSVTNLKGWDLWLTVSSLIILSVILFAMPFTTICKAVRSNITSTYVPT